MPTVGDLLDEAEGQIGRSRAVDLWRKSDARINAEELMETLLGREISSDDLDEMVGASDARRYRGLVKRRAEGEPVAMIIGKTEFMGLDLEVRPGVFIPRNSSENLATEAIARLRRRPKSVAVDLATGSGPVALAIAKKVPASKVWGLDISKEALELARRNASQLKLSNVTFLQSDLTDAIPRQLRGKVDTFTIHPPYVARDEVSTLPKEIRAFEPKHTLTDRSDDGLGLVRRLASDAPDWLRSGGWVLVEVSPNLSRKVRGILQRAGFEKVKSVRDSLGATRVISGALPKSSASVGGWD
jgi:release factor glutamine methyltransferase